MHYHHIIPKYLGGTDDDSNLILLTPIEHANAHLKLFKQYGNQADAWAYNRLMRQAKAVHIPLYVAPNKGKKFSNEINVKKGRFGKNNAMSKPDIKIKHAKQMEKLRGDDRLKNTGSKNPASKSISINNCNFQSIIEAATYYKVGRDTVRGWLNGVIPQKKHNIIYVHYNDIGTK